MRLKIFTTGGTIDKVYFDSDDQFAVGEPQIAQILEEAAVSLDFQIEQLMRKDSLSLTDADRALIRKRVADDPGQRFLITHGTDTMTETAAVLRGLTDKVVVLTGALSPARFRASDAWFNTGMAVAAAQIMPPGVYIAMNGCIFEAHKVRKNRKKNRFEPVG